MDKIWLSIEHTVYITLKIIEITLDNANITAIKKIYFWFFFAQHQDDYLNQINMIYCKK